MHSLNYFYVHNSTDNFLKKNIKSLDLFCLENINATKSTYTMHTLVYNKHFPDQGEIQCRKVAVWHFLFQMKCNSFKNTLSSCRP